MCDFGSSLYDLLPVWVNSDTVEDLEETTFSSSPDSMDEFRFFMDIDVPHPSSNNSGPEPLTPDEEELPQLFPTSRNTMPYSPPPQLSTPIMYSPNFLQYPLLNRTNMPPKTTYTVPLVVPKVSSIPPPRPIQNSNTTPVPMKVENAFSPGGDLEPYLDFKLPQSKSPIMEATTYCAVNNWGIEIFKNQKATPNGDPAEVIFRVTDFQRYSRLSRLICSKQNPTEDGGARVKTLRRWFCSFPKKKERNLKKPFFLVVKPGSKTEKVSTMIEKTSKLSVATKKIRV